MIALAPAKAGDSWFRPEGALPAAAGAYTWDATSTDWYVTQSGGTGAPWALGDTAVFKGVAGGYGVTLAVDQSVSGITFGAGTNVGNSNAIALTGASDGLGSTTKLNLGVEALLYAHYGSAANLATIGDHLDLVGDFTLIGPGRLYITGAGSLYSGTIKIGRDATAGNLFLNNTSRVSSGTNVTLDNGFLTLGSGSNRTIGNLSGGGGNIQRYSGAMATLTMVQTETSTWAGRIDGSGDANNVSINKQGVGTLIMSAEGGHGMRGALKVEAGGVYIRSALSDSSNAVEVSEGAVFGGTLESAKEVQLLGKSSILAPGMVDANLKATAGTLTLGGGITAENGATLHFDMNGMNLLGETVHDRIILSVGGFSLGAGQTVTVNFSNLGTGEIQSGVAYTIVSGLGLPSLEHWEVGALPSLWSVGDNPFTMVGNDLQITFDIRAIPEPSGAMLGILGAGLWFAGRRLRRFWVISSRLMVFAWVGCAVTSASALDLLVDGKPKARIYMEPPGENEQEWKKLREAVDDFNSHLLKMSGDKLEVVETSDPKSIRNPALVVGTLAERVGETAPPTRWQEGYRIQIGEDRGLVIGETDQATSYGLYDLLGQLGCDWVMPGPLGEIIPERKTVQLKPQQKDDAPAFGQRNFKYTGGRRIVNAAEQEEYRHWTRRMRLGRSEALIYDGQGHFWQRLISKEKEAFKANPEMLALVRRTDGSLVRKGPQIETTHPDIVSLLEKHVREVFEKNQWPKDKEVTLPLGPADGMGYSVSPQSRQLVDSYRDPMLGGPHVTPLIISLFNDLLERIGEEYPNLSLGYYVYSSHAGFPDTIKPHPRIYPTLAPISYSRFHYTTDPYSKSRPYHRRAVEKWAAHAKENGTRLQVYEYNWNLADNMLPFTRVEMLANELRFYHEMGVVGITLECVKSWAVTGPGDYVAARMAWDPSQDWEVLLGEYCRHAYGAAGPDMERYFKRIAAIQRTSGREAGSYHSAPLIFDDAYLVEAERNLNQASKQKLTPRQQVFLEATRDPDRILRKYLSWQRNLNRFDFAAARKDYDAMLAIWQQTLERNSHFACRLVPRYMKGLLLASTEQGQHYSSAPYSVLERLPDQIATALDPNGIGEELNLVSPEINDRDWMRTRTYGSTWDAQGLGFYRDGAVWYRFHFEVPPERKGEQIGLFLGGFEDVATVWVNGKKMGKSRVQFLEPAVFNITEPIRFGEKNVLAIQIKTHAGHINELFLGGLIRPSFLFAGPKIESTNAVDKDAPHVLPGAGKES